MTKVFLKNTRRGVIVKISGHALRPSDIRDYNIACACISAVSYSAYNIIRKMQQEGRLENCKMEAKPGYMYMSVTARREYLRDLRCHMDMLRTGLAMIKEKYPKSMCFVG